MVVLCSSRTFLWSNLVSGTKVVLCFFPGFFVPMLFQGPMLWLGASCVSFGANVVSGTNVVARSARTFFFGANVVLWD